MVEESGAKLARRCANPVLQPCPTAMPIAILRAALSNRWFRLEMCGD
jgi:hypothetical protein